MLTAPLLTTPVLTAAVRGVSVWGPGLSGWGEARATLAGERPYAPAPVALPAPDILSATERRRAGRVTRLALAAAAEAAAASGLSASGLRTVFGSGNGDPVTVTAILQTLSQADGAVSPTQFHNSVHNAAAGYWSIGHGSAQPAISLGCFDSTWAASLLAAMAEVRAAQAPVLLVAYDVEMPAPLSTVRDTPAAFGAALVLAPALAPEADAAQLSVRHEPEPGETLPADPALHALFRANPAARALPVLEHLAARRSGEVLSGYLDGHLHISVRC